MKIRYISFIPLSIGLMLYPSLVLQVALDGAGSVYNGFPLPWNSRSLVTSLAKDIYWIPLIIDILFYAVIGFIIWNRVSKFIFSWHPGIKLAIIILIWLYGLAAALFMLNILTLNALQYYWFFDDFKIINFYLGPAV